MKASRSRILIFCARIDTVIVVVDQSFIEIEHERVHWHAIFLRLQVPHILHGRIYRQYVIRLRVTDRLFLYVLDPTFVTEQRLVFFECLASVEERHQFRLRLKDFVKCAVLSCEFVNLIDSTIDHINWSIRGLILLLLLLLVPPLNLRKFLLEVGGADTDG